MPVFMVERYVPALSPEGVEAQARTDEALALGAGIQHVRTTYTPEDELIFSFFEAPDRDAVIAANDRAAAAFERIVEVVESTEASAYVSHTAVSTLHPTPKGGQP
jgi:hypothetical protein